MQSLEKFFPDGTLEVEGEHMSYVADDFVSKIQADTQNNSSPQKKIPTIPVVDGNVLIDLEKNAIQLSKSVDVVFQELSKRLNQMSAISVANVQTCSNGVLEMGSKVEEAVHSMYALLAHCEELDKSMKPVAEIAEKIEHIKEVLSALEAHID